MLKALRSVAVGLIVGFGLGSLALADDFITLLGASNTAYTQPGLTNHYLDAAGDSRTYEANEVTLMYSGTDFTNFADIGSAYPAWLYPLSGSAYIPHLSWNYGVGAQTTAGIPGRINSTRTDCNGTAFSGLPCFTGVLATTSGTTSSGSSTIVLSGTSTGVVDGMYPLGLGASLTAGTYVTHVSVATNTTVTLNTPTLASLGSGTQLVFATAAEINPYWIYLYSGTDVSGADGENNTANFGTYSLCSDPAKVVYLLIGTNDTFLSAAPSSSLENITAILNALGPSGCNKIVILSDEIPRGLAEGTDYGGYELHTIASGSATVTNSSLYYDTTGVCYVPTTSAPGSGLPFTPGTNDGVCLTKVASSPAQGQYSVASGVYTFNSADNGNRVGIYYRWKNYTVAYNVQTGSNYLTTIHNFIESNAVRLFHRSALRLNISLLWDQVSWAISLGPRRIDLGSVDRPDDRRGELSAALRRPGRPSHDHVRGSPGGGGDARGSAGGRNSLDGAVPVADLEQPSLHRPHIEFDEHADNYMHRDHRDPGQEFHL